MLRATSWLCLAALALSACGETEPVDTTSAFAQLAASAGDEAWVEDGADDCTHRAVREFAIVVRDAPCEGIDLRGAALAAVSDRLAVAAVTRSGPGAGWVFEGSVRTTVERTPYHKVKVVKKKVGKGKRRRTRRVERTVKVERDPVHRTVHIRCTQGEVELDVSHNHGPVRSLPGDGASCTTDGRVVQVMVPLAAFVVPGAARPALTGRVTLSLARRLEDRSRVRDILDQTVTVRLDAGPCDRAGAEIRCPPWSPPSSSAP